MFIHNPKQHKSITLSEPQGTLNTRRHRHEMQTQLCAGRDIKQNSTGELLWRDSGGIHWRILASRSGSILAGYSAGSTGKGYSAGLSAGSTGELLWDTQRDSRREPLAGCSGGILGGIHWPLWRDTRRDLLRAALAGHSAGSTGEPLGGILVGIRQGAALAGYWAIHWRAALRDPLASRSGGILGGIHSGGILGGIQWRAALAGYYWAGSNGEQLWRSTGELLLRDTWRDILESCSGGILGGAWCRSIANADSNIKSNNPFLSGGGKKRRKKTQKTHVKETFVGVVTNPPRDVVRICLPWLFYQPQLKGLLTMAQILFLVNSSDVRGNPWFWVRIELEIRNHR